MSRLTPWAMGLLVIVAATPSRAGEPPRSVSLGNASDGHLVNGKAMPARGPAFRVMPATLKRGYRYGGDELVGALERAAAAVDAEFKGSTLLIANMSREGGGDIGPSVSHNSGRDADIGFYAMDARGRPVDVTTLVVFDAAGVSGELRFDTRRNWAFVKALLTDPAVQVQWLFCKSALREKLLAYARSKGEPEDLIARADGVLGEPGNSSAHSEHFHVRLYCAKHERLLGCLNYGPTHPWVDDFERDVVARTETLVAELAGRDEPKVIAAIELIGAIRGTTGAPALAAVVRGTASTKVKLAALDALALLSVAAVAPDLAAALDARPDPAVTTRLVTALATIADPRTAPSLAAVAAGPTRPEADRVMALKGLGAMLVGGTVPTVAALLADSSKAVQTAAVDALLRIANRTYGKGARAKAKWLAWWEKNQEKARIDWVREAFAEGGVVLRAEDSLAKKLRAVKQLVGKMRKGGALSLNARALIEDVAGFSMNQGHFTDFQMFRFYRSWLASGAVRRALEAPTAQPAPEPVPTTEP